MVSLECIEFIDLIFREISRLLDAEYLRFPVRKLAASFKVTNTRLSGAEFSEIHTTVAVVKVSAI